MKTIRISNRVHAALSKSFLVENPASVSPARKIRVQPENGLEATPFDHRYIDAVCGVAMNPPILLIRLSGHLGNATGIIKGSQGW